MDGYDLKRKYGLIDALNKAKEKAQITLLYLMANDRDYEDIANVVQAVKHIEIALGHLGIEKEDRLPYSIEPT